MSLFDQIISPRFWFEKLSAQIDRTSGSTTACVASLHCEKGQLDVANLGDSGALVVQRDGRLGPWQGLFAEKHFH